MADKKQIKGILFISIALLLGIALVILSSDGILGKSSKSETKTVCAAYEKELEKRLTEIIEKLDGVTGKVNVMVTVYGDFEKGKAPEVRGVAVICSAKADIRAKITELVASTLNISSARIFVGEMS